MKYVWINADYSQAEARVVAWKGPVPALKTWFLNGEDVHLNVAKMIARVVQVGKIKLPRNLFMGKPWDTYTAEDPERQIAKNCVHGNNYGLGPFKFGLMTGLPKNAAEMVQNIYFSIFPEIKTGYQAGIRACIDHDRTITLPEPIDWKRTFYDISGDELYRAAYAAYAQSTIGGKLVRLWDKLCHLFDDDIPEGRLAKPSVIRTMGLDVRLNVHDSVGVIVPDSDDVILHTCRTIKKLGEEPLIINNEPLIIPMDFKVGPNFGDLKKYKLDI